MNGTYFLGVTLKVAAHEREILVDPDEDAPTVEVTFVATPYDDESFFVLTSHGVEEFGTVSATALPVGPDEGNGSGVFIVIHETHVGGQHRADVARIGAVFNGEQVARVVPRRRGQQ
jgi:hypothetical protein